MPIEIKELHIKVVVNQPQDKNSESSAGSSDNLRTEEKEEISSTVVEQIVEIIKNKDER